MLCTVALPQRTQMEHSLKLGGLAVPKNMRLKHVLLRDVLKRLVLPAAAQPRHTA